MGNKFRTLLLIVIVTFLMPFMAVAQQLPPIPVDSNVRIGKLENGLTYYIRHNEYPKGQADFFIAQKVGSIQEEDHQRGLAHFLEHMCFNGTKNFPGNQVVSWLESVGVKFGYNLNAYTSIERTVYNISQVPTERVSVQDSCLLILHDWANDLLLDGEEIDKERNVIHQEWRRTMVGEMRIVENLLPVVYPDSRYGYRFPIGTMEVVDNFPHKALRDYYEKWYRPDLQGIIVVGDIDVDRIEGKIKEMFSSIEMPENPAAREYLPVADNQETIYAIGKDKEMSNAKIEFMFKREAVSDSAKGNLDYLVENYATRMICDMLNARFADMMTKPDATFAVAQCSDGDFFISKTKDALTLVGVGKGNDIRPTMEAVYREVLRAKRGGFTATEYARVRSEYLTQLENAYKNRATQTSTQLAKEYVEHYLDNEPIPGIENEYQIMSMIANQIPVEALNMAFKEMVPQNNTVVMALLPDNADYYVPTEAELAQVMKNVEAENIEAYVDNVKSEPLIANLPVPGKIVSEVENPLYGTTEWALSNGAKVIVKTTTFKDDEILFEAVSKGGTSIYSDDDALNLRYLPIAFSQYGLGQYTYADLQKYMAGKKADISISLKDYSRSLEGATTPKDLQTLMELLYMHFTAFDITADEFAATQNIYAGMLQNQESNPQYIFQKLLTKSMHESPRNYALDVETIQGANRDRIVEIVREQLANPGEFSFIFVGNVDKQILKPLVEQYIASIPGKSTSNEVKLAGLGVKKGSENESAKIKMETPQSFAAIVVSADMPYTPKNHKLATIAGQILSTRLIETVREKEGAVYSISAHGGMSRIADNPVILQSAFPLKPELKEKVLDIIASQFSDMTKNVSVQELNKVKEFLVKTYTEELEKNEGWLGGIAGYELRPIDTFNSAIDTVNSITTEDVQKFMSDLLKQENYRVFVLDPEQ